MISYKRLQILLIQRDIKKQDLVRISRISWATMAKLNTNQYVSLEVIERLCLALGCQPNDIFEYIPEIFNDED